MMSHKKVPDTHRYPTSGTLPRTGTLQDMHTICLQERPEALAAQISQSSTLPETKLNVILLVFWAVYPCLSYEYRHIISQRCRCCKCIDGKNRKNRELFSNSDASPHDCSTACHFHVRRVEFLSPGQFQDNQQRPSSVPLQQIFFIFQTGSIYGSYMDQQ